MMLHVRCSTQKLGAGMLLFSLLFLFFITGVVLCCVVFRSLFICGKKIRGNLIALVRKGQRKEERDVYLLDALAPVLRSQRR